MEAPFKQTNPLFPGAHIFLVPGCKILHSTPGKRGNVRKTPPPPPPRPSRSERCCRRQTLPPISGGQLLTQTSAEQAAAHWFSMCVVAASTQQILSNPGSIAPRDASLLDAWCFAMYRRQLRLTNSCVTLWLVSSMRSVEGSAVLQGHTTHAPESKAGRTAPNSTRASQKGAAIATTSSW